MLRASRCMEQRINISGVRWAWQAIELNPRSDFFECPFNHVGGHSSRFSKFGLPVNWIAADIVRLQDGKLVEHWDVIEDEATQEQSKSGLPMFGDKFPQ